MPPSNTRPLTFPMRRDQYEEVADKLGIDPVWLSKWRQKKNSPSESMEVLTEKAEEPPAFDGISAIPFKEEVLLFHPTKTPG